MKSKPALFIASAVVLVFVAILVVFATPGWRHHQLIRRSQPVLVALESYRQQHGAYPESLSAAKIQEPEELYYRREADGSYILWFGLQLGESMTFHSADHTWR